MPRSKRVKYFTEDKLKLINVENRKLYDKYLKSNIIKNKDVKNTTYYVYENYMNHFLVYVAEEWENVGLYDEEFIENAVDIMEGFISFCQDTLGNNKKVINTKLSTVSSFYIWSVKRGFVDSHPFDRKLDRMKNANDEKIITSHFLTEEQINTISDEIEVNPKYDTIDRMLWHIALDSANRIGALEKLTLSSLDLENCIFSDIREKRGYRVEVPFSIKTKDIIIDWLDKRKDMDNLEVDALFIVRYSGQWVKMSKTSLQQRIKRMGEIINIPDLHPHDIRKSVSNLIIEKTGDITLSAELLNHKSIETTRQHYCKPKSKTEVRDKIARLLNQNKENEDVDN